MQTNFPWLRTKDGPDQLNFVVDLIDGQMFARAPSCNLEVLSLGLCCTECSTLAPKVAKLAEATSYRSRTRRTLLSCAQLVATIDERNQELNRWKLKVCLFFNT
jgi:hypothetical protein